MLCDNCEKVVLKSIQRKYYKTVINIEMGEEVNMNSKTEQQIQVKKPVDIPENEKLTEKKLKIFE